MRNRASPIFFGSTRADLHVLPVISAVRTNSRFLVFMNYSQKNYTDFRKHGHAESLGINNLYYNIKALLLS